MEVKSVKQLVELMGTPLAKFGTVGDILERFDKEAGLGTTAFTSRCPAVLRQYGLSTQNFKEAMRLIPPDVLYLKALELIEKTCLRMRELGHE